MERQRHIIYVPGLHDWNPAKKIAVWLMFALWRFFGFRGHVIYMRWEDGGDFGSKLGDIIAEIDRQIARGHVLYLVGVSAGASAALNAYAARKESVRGVASVAGRLRAGKNVRPSLDHAAQNSAAFKGSVELFESINECTLSDSDRQKSLLCGPFQIRLYWFLRRRSEGL